VIEINHFPVLIIDDQVNVDTMSGRAVRSVMDELKKMDISMQTATTFEDGLFCLQSQQSISAIVLDWEAGTDKNNNGIKKLIQRIREVNEQVPIVLMTEKRHFQDIDVETIGQVSEYVWKLEDTADFIAGRIRNVVKEYLTEIFPPFFGALMDYAEHYKYAWHTPGHAGGIAFLKSPIGRVFYEFLGENVFRSDLSCSVEELGSLMDHTHYIGAAENFASKVFGSDRTYFVTNGTSTSNKVVMCGSVSQGDVVLVDRNCHKSIQHAITMTGVIPVYLVPTRNAHGIIGGIPLSDMQADSIAQKINDCPLISDKKAPIKLAIITNSTYDGLVYNVVDIKEQLSSVVDRIHFDEAWFPYGHFHDLYTDRYAMCEQHEPHHPTIFSTQSTHKLLAAFSQASMIHMKEGKEPVDAHYFNEAFMMHTSTSPQYTIIASLDVSSKMMQGNSGSHLVEQTIEEAVVFRKKFAQLRADIMVDKNRPEHKRWFFDLWQPDSLDTKRNLTKEALVNYCRDPNTWCLKSENKWHGYGAMSSNQYLMLDPIKVSILTPGVRLNGDMESWGIPAPVLSRFLSSRGIVDEKTGFYVFLLLFSMGVTRGKSGTLLSELLDFKKFYDDEMPLNELFPVLLAENPGRYDNLTLPELCNEMHLYLKSHRVAHMAMDMLAQLPTPAMTPSEAFRSVVHKKVEEVPLNVLQGRVTAVMVVPYPPGIPIIMPGERFDEKTQLIVRYLQVLEEFNNRFPGFETKVHGVIVKKEDEGFRYYVPCVFKP